MNFVWFRRAILRVLKFLKIKEGGIISWGEPVLQSGWIILSPLLYFNFKSFNNPISSSFIRLQCILHNSGVSFSDLWNFHKLKRGDQISGENQFYRTNFTEPIQTKFELFGPPFCISILKYSRNQFLRHSLDFIAFCRTQEKFPQTFEISIN